MAIFIGERDSIQRGLDVIEVLVRQGEPAVQRTLIVDTPWVEVRWPNPKYL